MRTQARERDQHQADSEISISVLTSFILAHYSQNVIGLFSK